MPRLPKLPKLRKERVKTEKITINLGPAELGQIDYLVERGLYTNRSDFIRLAIRKQTDNHAHDIGQFLSPAWPETELQRYFGGLGILRLTRADVEGWIAIGAHVHIHIVGALRVDKSITPEDVQRVVASVRVHGKIFAEEGTKQALLQFNEIGREK